MAAFVKLTPWYAKHFNATDIEFMIIFSFIQVSEMVSGLFVARKMLNKYELIKFFLTIFFCFNLSNHFVWIKNNRFTDHLKASFKLSLAS